MATLELSRENFVAILSGFGVVLVMSIIMGAISFSINYNMLGTQPIAEFKSIYTQQPYQTYSWILQIISFLTPLLGGFVVGWIIKEKGWLHGGLLGILLTLLALIFATLIFLLPATFIYGTNIPSGFGKDESLQGILNIILFSPITLLKTAIGGYLGERLQRRNRKKKN